MSTGDLQFIGYEDPPIDVSDVHRWYRFARSDGTTARVGITRDAATARRDAGDGDDELDEWVIDVGRGILADRLPDTTTEVVIDLPGDPDDGA
ncbi:MAG: hypothetical protein U0Y82_05390 [Thermoleophilia bacterium]